MTKLWLIIQREYLTRVKRRSFILATLLTPLALGLFFVVVNLIFSYESDDVKRVAIIDEGNLLERRISDERNLFFKFVDSDLATLRANLEETGYSGILVIPPVSDLMSKRFSVSYYTNEKLTLDTEPLITYRVQEGLRAYKVREMNLDPEQLAALDFKVDISPRAATEGKEGEADAGDQTMNGAVGALLGMLMGFVMYMTVFIYGMMVMRSVMEEKTSRIVEVMISSVRPFQLMLGKIIGVGAVGLTQVAVWAVLVPAIIFGVSLAFGIDSDQMSAANMPEGMSREDAEFKAAQILSELKQVNWWVIFPLFVLYFLGGYFLYASLFAAVGSAMGDDLGEGQSLTIPITIPVILALYIMMAAVQSPNSSLAVWSSIFPLFSPIVMPARLAFDPPAWQILLSLAVLLGSTVLFVWLSGRIYRIGILLYGKKVGLKDLGKWLFVKD